MNKFIFLALLIFVAVNFSTHVFADKQSPAAQNTTAQKEAEIHKSGYLGPDEIYDRLVKTKTKSGKVVYRWKGPKLTKENFNSVLIENIVLYPKPEPTEQVSEDTLKRISAYTTNLLKEKIGAIVPLANEPGPGVLIMEPAITGVIIKTEGMKPYEILPVAAVFGAAKAATGTRAQDVLVQAEIKFIDSTNGELVGAAMRSIEGDKLKGKKDQLAVEDMHENLEHSTTEAASYMETIFSE
jgi:hypothetical protein